jgi:NADH-quinone oxidoreductase subunit K
MNTPVEHYLLLAAVLFAIGALGVLIRRNVIVILMSIELMLNAVNITFVALARQQWSIDGQVVVFFVMTVAAAEVAVGLAIILLAFSQRKTINADEIHLLRW